jgi:hypothetical protein
MKKMCVMQCSLLSSAEWLNLLNSDDYIKTR